MKYTKLLIIFCFAFTLASCDFGSNSNTSNNTPTETNTPPPPPAEKTDNWLVIPGEQVGRIKANANGADIYKMFGDDNVDEAEIGLGEGETAKGLLIFPRTKNELQVLFAGGEKMEKIESIKIKGEGSMWKTASGIAVGTTLEELVKLNGKDFKFYGFEWDYAGKLASWDGGKLSENLSVFLEATDEEAVFPDLIGDIAFSSSLPQAKKAGLKVTSFTINF